MKITKRPEPIDNEKLPDSHKTIMSKTNHKGIIEFANNYFVEISRYKVWELMGQPHNVVRHPDMPRVIFKWLWDRLKHGKPIRAFVKNLSKDGSYYWVIADVRPVIKNDTVKFYSRRKGITDKVKNQISNLYRELKEVEKVKGMEGSEAFFNDYLKSINLDYDSFVLQVLGMTEKELDHYIYEQISKSEEEYTNVSSGEIEDLLIKLDENEESESE